MGERDERDETTWIVFELKAAGERLAAEGGLESHLRRTLGLTDTHPIFVPYLSFTHGGRTTIFNSMEGYAFVAHSGVDDRTCFHSIVESPYLRSVLHSRPGKGPPVLMTVPNSSVETLRHKLREMISVDIEEGMEVDVISGEFVGLSGTVLSLSEEQAHVFIKMRTLRTIRTIPRFSLHPRGDHVDEAVGEPHSV